MKATLYKELSNTKTPIELPAGTSIKKALPDVDIENAIIIINGKVEKPDYILKEKDIVTIRLTPAGMEVLIVTLIAVAVVAVGTGIAGGIAAYKAKQEAEKAQEELDKVKKLTNKSDIDNRPFLRGALNTKATGNSQPYIIGRHLFTPYLLCSPFYQITGTDGADQYTCTVLGCGFNKQIIHKLAIDDITIKTFTDTTPQEGAFNLDTGIFAEGGRIEIAQDGTLLTELTSLNYKTESKLCNDKIPCDTDVQAGTSEYLTYTLNPYAKDVDIAITFPYGLYAINDNGDKVETQVTITPQYSLDGGGIWVDFTFDNNGTATNTFKCNVPAKELRYVAHQDFTAADYNTLKANRQTAIYIRIRNNGNSDNNIRNDCYCLYYQSVCFDPDQSMSGTAYTSLQPCKIVEDRERAFCTILGLMLKATSINEDKLKKINIITQGVARTWNGRIWSATKSATSNPAAWALEILTSDSHPASKYNNIEVDLDSFGDYYDFCKINGYKFDYVITQNMKKNDVLHYIMEATGACIYYDIFGRLAVAIDRPQENALAVYNPQNIINIQNKKTFGRKTDGLRIKYINSSNDLYQQDTYLLMREVDGVPLQITPNSIIKDLTVTGITTFDHIVKYARRLMAIEVLRPKTTIIEVGNEGVFYTPFSKILIQDDSLKIGIGKGYTIRDCQWYGGILKKIYTNELLTFAPQKTYGIIVNCFTHDSVTPVALKVSGTGTSDELTVISTIRSSAPFKPESGDIFSFGELDNDGEFSKVTTEYVISNIKRSDKGFNIELVNYNQAIYDSGKIPRYKSNITKKTTAQKKQIPADTVTHSQLEAIQKAAINASNEAVQVVTSGIHFTNVHRIKEVPGIDTIESLRAAIDDAMKQASDGISVTEDKITLQVSDSERKTHSLIELTRDRILQTVQDSNNNIYSVIDLLKNQITLMVDDKNNLLRSAINTTHDNIISQVDNMQVELRGLINIQSSSVAALVAGGGAAGHMSVSLELPIMIDAATHTKFVRQCGQVQTNAVYAKLANTDYYAIKGNASQTEVKALWDRALAQRLIASQIVLSADQINIAGTTVFTANKTTSAITTAQQAAAQDATRKANAAQQAAQQAAANQRNEIAEKLGYTSYNAMVAAAQRGQTIIHGGRLRTALIEVEQLLAKNITVRGSLQSTNYRAGSQGWKINGNGKAEFEDGVFRGQVNATSGVFSGNIKMTDGFLQANNTPFKPMAMLNVGFSNGRIKLISSKNVRSVTRPERGVYNVYFTTPVKLRTHRYEGKHYIDVFVIANVSDTFHAGFRNPLICNPNWLRNAVDRRLAIDKDGCAYVEYVVLYFIDNNTDDLIDPITAQTFIFGTETN